MSKHKKLILGTSSLNNTSLKKLSVSLPKDALELMGLYAGTPVEITGYMDPVEIIISPKTEVGNDAEDMMEQALKSKPWRLRATP